MSAPPNYNLKSSEPLPTGYYQQSPYANPNVQQTQPLPIGNPMVIGAGDYSVPCSCPYCHQSIATRVEKDNGLAVWLAVGVLCFIGCFCGCCLIPFCIDDIKDTIHYCPNCNTVVARNKKL